jgi:hypothetical protein
MRFSVDLLDIYIYRNQSPGAIIATTLLVCIILVIGIFKYSCSNFNDIMV